MNYVITIAISTIVLKRCSVNGDFDKNRVDRIVGGSPANITQYPFQLCIILKTSEGLQFTDFKGAAVIVSSQWAFTSGNNIAFLDKKLFTAGLVYLRGNVTKWNDKRLYNDHQIIETHIHPDYKTYARDYNIALVKIKNTFNGRYEKPIKVVGKHYQYQDNLKVFILGWGKIFVTQKGPTDSLKIADVVLVNQEQCNKIYSKGYVSPLTPRMICGIKPGIDSCVYDSGGPLIYKKTLLALISWGRNCADSPFPEIYTRLTEFHDWILTYEKENNISLNIKFVDNV